MGSPRPRAPTAGELPLSGSSLLKWLPVCLLLLPSFSLCVGLLQRCLPPVFPCPGPCELRGSSGGCGAECAGKGPAWGEGVPGAQIRGVSGGRSPGRRAHVSLLACRSSLCPPLVSRPSPICALKEGPLGPGGPRGRPGAFLGAARGRLRLRQGSPAVACLGLRRPSGLGFSLEVLVNS